MNQPFFLLDRARFFFQEVSVRVISFHVCLTENPKGSGNLYPDRKALTGGKKKV